MSNMGAYNRDCPYLYRGVVESNEDPKNLGRCRIRVPSIHGDIGSTINILPWARPIVLSSVGKGKGSINIPDVGDIVWVFFEGSSRNCPVYFGGTYAIGDVDIDKDVVKLYTEHSDEISYHRKDRRYTIKVGDIALVVAPTGVAISGDTSISGDVSILGTLTVDNLIINGSCNKECDC